MIVPRKLFLIGCVVSSCLNVLAQPTRQHAVEEETVQSEKITELLLVTAERDNAGFHVTEACHCTPENVVALVRAMNVPANERRAFAERLLEALSPSE
jgi:hypothetical protein